MASVTCPIDLEVEIMGALKVEEEEPRDRTQAFLPQIFEQAVPHMRYQRLVIFRAGNSNEVMVRRQNVPEKAGFRGAHFLWKV